MKKLIRVVITDDHPIVREGLRLIVEKAGDMELVGEAADGTAAIRQAEELQPDVVLMDLRMPGMDGLAAIGRIRREWPQIGVLILTTYSEDELMIRGLRAGALGYLLKWARKPLVLSQGMNGPLALRSVLLHGRLQAGETAQLAGALAPHKPPNGHRWPGAAWAGPAGNRQGATGVGFSLALPVDGPPETALGLRPRTVKP